MTSPDWLVVVPRPFPGSTMIVLHGPQPIVVDPGAATDADLLPELLGAACVRANRLQHLTDPRRWPAVASHPDPGPA